jgi:4-hydroxy-3-methylbut-2-en-1-yl diphosphate reductase
MKVIKATHLGMCFGVRDAIQLAESEAKKQPITILGELVHNPAVNNSLAQQGVVIKKQIEDVTTQTVVISAHGASDRRLERVKAQGHRVLEATCPLVHFAHRAVQELVLQGRHPIIIGKVDHIEVQGIVEDLDAYNIVLTEDDVMQIEERPRFGIVAQTTQPIQRVRYLVQLIQQRFPQSDIAFRDTVCQPTKQRQAAAEELAKQCDVVIVVGGHYSNNTRELAETCRQFCERVVQIQSASELKPLWFYNASTVGITAGTSTPDFIIDSVEQQLQQIAASKEYLHCFHHDRAA